jgi:hypothetical protein
MRYMPGGKPVPREQLAASLGRMMDYWQEHGLCLWAVEDNESGRLIGRQEDEAGPRAGRVVGYKKPARCPHTRRRGTRKAPIRHVRDACALLRDGMLEAGPTEKTFLINLLVEVIYADREGWELVGYLPGMDASGTFGEASIEERTS